MAGGDSIEGKDVGDIKIRKGLTDVVTGTCEAVIDVFKLGKAGCNKLRYNRQLKQGKNHKDKADEYSEKSNNYKIKAEKYGKLIEESKNKLNESTNKVQELRKKLQQFYGRAQQNPDEVEQYRSEVEESVNELHEYEYRVKMYQKEVKKYESLKKNCLKNNNRFTRKKVKNETLSDSYTKRTPEYKDKVSKLSQRSLDLREGMNDNIAKVFLGFSNSFRALDNRVRKRGKKQMDKRKRKIDAKRNKLNQGAPE